MTTGERMHFAEQECRKLRLEVELLKARLARAEDDAAVWKESFINATRRGR